MSRFAALYQNPAALDAGSLLYFCETVSQKHSQKHNSQWDVMWERTLVFIENNA